MIRERSFNPYFSYFLTVASVLIAVFMVLIALLALVQPAQAQTYTLLHSFGGVGDGRNPSGTVVLDQAGNLYGTTSGGGCCVLGGVPFVGTVFKLDQAGHETVLHTFTGGPDGRQPSSLVLDAAGNLYGTTLAGGLCSNCTPSGVIFKLDQSGHETVLHTFAYWPDGANPQGSLVLDATGNLFGATAYGGAYGYGVVFELDSAGHFTVLHTFQWTDGAYPLGGVLQDAAGNLYGTTSAGGSHACGIYTSGLLFKLDPQGQESTVHSFGCPDGANSLASLTLDAAGNLYGTTELGGAYGAGVVFKVDPAGNETVLYSFTGMQDGGAPYGGVVLDAAGNIYGTTYVGGGHQSGAVFKLDPAGHETVLHGFTGADGKWPSSGLVLDPAGNLYGTTSAGGAYGRGVVFKITLP